MRSRALCSLALFAASAAAFVACSSDPAPEPTPADRDRPSKDAVPLGPSPVANPGTTSVAIASPASDAVYVTMRDTVALRGISSGSVSAVGIESSAGEKIVATGTATWQAEAVPVPLGQSSLTVSAGDAKDALVVVRTKQIGFTEPATIVPDGVIAKEKTKALVRVPLDPATTLDRSTLTLSRKKAGKLTAVAFLHDDGKAGDETAGDGTYSAELDLDEPDVGRTTFYVGGRGPQGEEQALALAVDVFEPLLEADVDATTALLTDLDAVWTKTHDPNAVLAAVRASTSVVEHAISADGGGFGISLHMKGDIPAVWNKPLPPGYKATPTVVGNTKALFTSGHYNDFAPNDEGPGLAGRFRANACPTWQTTGCILNEAVTVQTMRTMPDFGVTHVSSHGETWAGLQPLGTPGVGCALDYEGCVKGFGWYTGARTEVIAFTAEHVSKAASTNDRASIRYAAELRQGRVGIGRGLYFVTPRFWHGVGKRFPKSIVMMSICRGAFNTSMGDALVRQGAAAYLGFTEYVASDFAFDVSNGIWNCLLEADAANPAGKSLASCLPAVTCDDSASTTPNAVVCQQSGGNVTCSEVQSRTNDIACLRANGDTSVTLKHTKPDGTACTATAPPPFCGDGAVGMGETCDGADIAGATCASATGNAQSQGKIGCKPDCQLDTSECFVCTFDNVIDAGEECDGTALGGETCATVTGNPKSTGTLGCSATCAFDTTGCAVCDNDGVKEKGEACDGTQFGGATCASITQQPSSIGTLSCSATCTIDSSACHPCNHDGKLDVGEDCDGAAFGYSCETAGYAGGSISCDADCRVDVSACVPYGCDGGAPNGVIDVNEACDGTAFGGATCASVLQDPKQDGTLQCTGDCRISTASCARACNGDGIKNNAESCEGTDFGGATCATALASPFATGTLACTPTCTLDTSACTVTGTCANSSCTVVSEQGLNGAPTSLPPFQPGCDSCTTQVCAQEPRCCNTAWDFVCYSLAKEKCGCP